MIDNFEIDGKVVDVNGHTVDVSVFCSIIQRLASRINLDKPEEFSIDAPFVFPKTIFHANLGIDHPRTNIPGKIIHIYLGFILVFCQLGSLERALRNVIGSRIPFDDIIKLDVKDISDDIKKILEYLRNLNDRKDNTVTFPKVDIRVNTYEIMVGYIYGHELSHYLDDIFDYDLRGKHQLEVMKYAIEYLTMFITMFKGTSYESYAAKMLWDLDLDLGTGRGKMIQRWSEELLADFQAYQFCLSSLKAVDSPLRRADMYIAISMVFAASKIIEFFRERILKQPIIDYIALLYKLWIDYFTIPNT